MAFAGLKEWFSKRVKNSRKMSGVFVLGAPGAGKTSLCSHLQKEFGFLHLSPGNLLREEVERGQSVEAALIKDHLAAGTLVPAEIPCRLLKNAIARCGKEKQVVLLDGFPRNFESLKCWEQEVADSVRLEMVLLLEVEEDTLIERCLRRRGRQDDNVSTLKTRLRVFREETMPLLLHFKSENTLKTVYSGVEKEEVLRCVIKLMKDNYLII